MNSATHAATDAAAPAEAEPLTKVSAHEHVPPLDGIRGTAILIVLIGHLVESVVGEWGMLVPELKLGLMGWIGVDLFFVLSGFLITGILYEAKGGDHYFRNFYARRALRIFPLYYTALAAVLIMSLIAPSLNVWGWESPGWMWVYLTNYKLAFGEADMFGVVDHFWSLAVEEHYYLVWPTIVFFFQRKTLMKIAVGAMIVALGVRLSCIEGDHMNMAGYMMTHARMDSLAAGSFVALAIRGERGIEPLIKPAFVVFGLAFCAVAAIVISRRAFTPDDMFLGTIGLSLLWAMFASMLIISLTWKPAVMVMSTAFLRWFGKYSYGMYVWHPIVIIILLHTQWGRSFRTGNHWVDMIGGVGLSVALVIGVSLLSWHLWEKQFLKLKKHFAH